MKIGRNRIITVILLSLSFIAVILFVGNHYPRYRIMYFLERHMPLKIVSYDKPAIDYPAVFNDLQSKQIKAARQFGLKQKPETRDDLVRMKDELTPVSDTYFYSIIRLSNSVYFLRPNALQELETVGRFFRYKLKKNGLPQYKILVTSLLRTQEDVDALRKVNSNATSNSCHSYGTTFDISYRYYDRVSFMKKTPSEDLKKILADVLREEKLAGRIYVKHEKNQKCFHITCRY